MKLKTKITSLVTTFILLCSLLTVGVFAVKNTTFNVGGDIVFNVQGIEATITRGATAGFTADKTIGNEVGNILSDIILDNTMSAQDVADEFAPWSGLNLAFSENVATIKLTITNTAEEGVDNYLDITALASATTKNNARVSVVNDAGGVTALLQPQQSASFTITFSVIDDEYSASLEGFSVNFDMQKKVLADFPKVESIEDKEDLLDQYEFSEYSQSAPYTVTIGAKGANDVCYGTNGACYTSTLSGDIVIPSYVNKDGIVYAVNKLADCAFGTGGYLTFDCTSLTLPKTLTTLGFSCMNLKKSISIEIPYGMTNIAREAFYDSKGISTIILPNSITNIEPSAFSGCSITKIEIPDSVTNIDESVFQGCGIQSITIPGTVKNIANSAFYQSSLQSITISEGVESIGFSAFAETGITSLEIPASVTSIGDGLLWGNTPNVKKIVVDSRNSVYDSRNNCNAIIETATNTLIEGSSATVIPNTVVKIGENAFGGRTDITEITIPESVKNIEDWAFSSCLNLKTVNYRGTQEQWNALLENVGSRNDYLIDAEINFNYTGE